MKTLGADPIDFYKCGRIYTRWAPCLIQLTPHRALCNEGDAVRWSMAFRYEAPRWWPRVTSNMALWRRAGMQGR